MYSQYETHKPIKRKGKTMTKSYTLEAVKKEYKELVRFTIAQLIGQHKLVRDRAFMPEETARALADHFDLIPVNQTFQLVPREKRLSTLSAGEYADAVETIEDLLSCEYKTHLFPNNRLVATEEKGLESEAPTQKPVDARLEGLKGKYLAAKEKRNYSSMTSLKRQIAEAGYAADIL